MCGERAAATFAAMMAGGSSPRVRGTPGIRQAAQYVRRFIPACAGNAIASSNPSGRKSVHPRVCGERFLRLPVSDLCSGSSPRVRGTPSRSARLISYSRFIPACAGNAVSVRQAYQ